RKVVAAVGEDVVLVGLEPLHVPAEPLDHELLQVDHALRLAATRHDLDVQQVGMADQELRMLAQILRDLRGGDATLGPVGGRRLAGVVGFLAHGCRYRIDCPVFAQSARKAARPLSVSGWLNSWRSTAGGSVATWAPILAASITCTGWRTDATNTSVVRAG